MKLSISNIAWSNEYDKEMYEFISKSGFTGIEIAPTKLITNPYENLEEAKKIKENLLKEYNLKISSMQSIWNGRKEKLFGSHEERRSLIDYSKKAIDFAKEIECKNLVFGSPRNRIIGDREKDYKIAIDFFREIGDYAASRGVYFSIEPNLTIYNTNFIVNTKEAVDIVKEIDSPGIRINFDLGTVIGNDEELSKIGEYIFLINHVHISEPNLEIIQKREMHKDLAKILRENNYQNYVSIEMKERKNIQDVKDVICYIEEVFR